MLVSNVPCPIALNEIKNVRLAMGSGTFLMLVTAGVNVGMVLGAFLNVPLPPLGAFPHVLV